MRVLRELVLLRVALPEQQVRQKQPRRVPRHEWPRELEF
jgi:hypothetical protein